MGTSLRLYLLSLAATRWLPLKSRGSVGVASTPLFHVHPFIFSCSFQQDLCLIKLLSFIIIKEKCGGRALQTPLNENQIVEPAGKQGQPCASGARRGTGLQRDRSAAVGTCPPCAAQDDPRPRAQQSIHPPAPALPRGAMPMVLTQAP